MYLISFAKKILIRSKFNNLKKEHVMHFGNHVCTCNGVWSLQFSIWIIFYPFDFGIDFFFSKMKLLITWIMPHNWLTTSLIIPNFIRFVHNVNNYYPEKTWAYTELQHPAFFYFTRTIVWKEMKHLIWFGSVIIDLEFQYKNCLFIMYVN